MPGMTQREVEQKKLDDFLDRAKQFLADDPYWMHVLTMPGGRAKRKQVANAFSKMMTTIPHLDPGENATPRAMRRAFLKSLPRELRVASGVKSSDLG